MRHVTESTRAASVACSVGSVLVENHPCRSGVQVETFGERGSRRAILSRDESNRATARGPVMSMSEPTPAASVECPECGGDGFSDPRVACLTCGHEARVAITCPACNGTGRAPQSDSSQAGEPRD